MKSKILLGVLVLTLTGCRFFTTKEVVETEPPFIITTYRPPIDNRRLDSLRAEFQSECVLDVYNLDVAPSFPGGTEAMQRFIEDNKRYPLAVAEMGIQGTVFVSFIVEQDGSLSAIHILKSPDPGLSREAMRVVSQMPKWIQGKRNGEIVRTRFTIPVVFRLP